MLLSTLTPTVFAVVAAFVPVPGQVDASGIPVPIRQGQPFPRLYLPAMADGRPMSMANFQGKKIILHVFASW